MEINNKGITLTVIGVALLLMALAGVTYSFFNYTRTGSANTLKVGRISFNHQETDTINLTNVFPVKRNELSANINNTDEVIINITGDTTYNEGIEYLVSVVDVNNTINSKTIPIGINVTVSNNQGGSLGTSDDSYFLNRGESTSIYKILAKDTITSSSQIVAGYIAKGVNGVNGTVTIEAFIDGDKIAISDTYDDNPSDYNGTTSEWVNGRTVLTTTEWNSLSTNGISFKVKVEANEGIWVKNDDSSYELIKRNSDIVTQINFGEVSSASNGEGIYRLLGTENYEYPIYYYRGNVNNNNVIFGGFCWQIIRTTSTGGIKMIYNGIATGNGTTCENTIHNDRIISSSVFNNENSSISDIGYMYNQRYEFTLETPTTGAYFGEEIEYGDFDNNSTNEYRLVSGKTSTTLDINHHYTCNLGSIDGTCSEIRYYYLNNHYILLSNGEKIEDALYKMTGTGTDEVKSNNNGYKLNNNDSVIKTEIEAWFKTNLTNEEDNNHPDYQKYLEDTVFCNNRDYQRVGENRFTNSGWNPKGGNLSTGLYFEAWNRWLNNNWYSDDNVPSFECNNITDKFSVNNEYAKLKYPVGLITADEIILAGASGNELTVNRDYYLYTGNYYWSMSPSAVYEIIVNGFTMRNGSLYDNNTKKVYGLRPVISLKKEIEFENDGNGTITNPYIVKYT